MTLNAMEMNLSEIEMTLNATELILNALEMASNATELRSSPKNSLRNTVIISLTDFRSMIKSYKFAAPKLPDSIMVVLQILALIVLVRIQVG